MNLNFKKYFVRKVALGFIFVAALQPAAQTMDLMPSERIRSLIMNKPSSWLNPEVEPLTHNIPMPRLPKINSVGPQVVNPQVEKRSWLPTALAGTAIAFYLGSKFLRRYISMSPINIPTVDRNSIVGLVGGLTIGAVGFAYNWWKMGKKLQACEEIVKSKDLFIAVHENNVNLCNEQLEEFVQHVNTKYAHVVTNLKQQHKQEIAEINTKHSQSQKKLPSTNLLMPLTPQETSSPAKQLETRKILIRPAGDPVSLESSSNVQEEQNKKIVPASEENSATGSFVLTESSSDSTSDSTKVPAQGLESPSLFTTAIDAGRDGFSAAMQHMVARKNAQHDVRLDVLPGHNKEDGELLSSVQGSERNSLRVDVQTAVQQKLQQVYKHGQENVVPALGDFFTGICNFFTPSARPEVASNITIQNLVTDTIEREEEQKRSLETQQPTEVVEPSSSNSSEQSSVFTVHNVGKVEQADIDAKMLQHFIKQLRDKLPKASAEHAYTMISAGADLVEKFRTSKKTHHYELTFQKQWEAFALANVEAAYQLWQRADEDMRKKLKAIKHTI